MKKFKTTGKGRTGNMGHHVKPNLQITGIDEKEESQVNGIEQVFNTIMDDNFPKQRKDVQIQSTKQIRSERKSPWCKYTEQRKCLENCKEKKSCIQWKTHQNNS